MINIWKYDSSDFIKLTDIDGKIYFGQVLALWDSDELESDSDEIHIENENGIYGFRTDEIQSIERIEDKKIK